MNDLNNPVSILRDLYYHIRSTQFLEGLESTIDLDNDLRAVFIDFFTDDNYAAARISINSDGMADSEFIQGEHFSYKHHEGIRSSSEISDKLNEVISFVRRNINRT